MDKLGGPGSEARAGPEQAGPERCRAADPPGPTGGARGGTAPVPVAVLLGCNEAGARQVLQAAPPGPRWLLGTPLPAKALPTEGLPPGLLALGEVARPPLEAAIHDAVELVARALGSAARVQAERALLPAMINCNDLPLPGPSPPAASWHGERGPCCRKPCVWLCKKREGRPHLSLSTGLWAGPSPQPSGRGYPGWEGDLE